MKVLVHMAEVSAHAESLLTTGSHVAQVATMLGILPASQTVVNGSASDNNEAQAIAAVLLDHRKPSLGGVHRVVAKPHKSAVLHEECGKADYQSAYSRIAGQAVRFNNAFARDIDPATGTGFAVLDVDICLPSFLHSEQIGKFAWPAKGTWAFGGDPQFAHTSA